MQQQLQIGQVLYGYCNGYFGRDSYNNKRVEAIGYDWIVVRELSLTDDGKPDFCYIRQEDHQELIKSSEQWKKEHNHG